MILLVLAAAALAAAPTCPASADPLASLCRALAASDSNNFAAAAAEFERAAAGSAAGDPRTQRMLAAAGNMWIAAAQPGKAALALDRALAGTGLRADQRGLALLDRARAAEAQGELKLARLYWQRAVAADPASASGEAAKRALTLANAPSPPATSPAKPAIKGQ